MNPRRTRTTIDIELYAQPIIRSRYMVLPPKERMQWTRQVNGRQVVFDLLPDTERLRISNPNNVHTPIEFTISSSINNAVLTKVAVEQETGALEIDAGNRSWRYEGTKVIQRRYRDQLNPPFERSQVLDFLLPITAFDRFDNNHIDICVGNNSYVALVFLPKRLLQVRMNGAHFFRIVRSRLDQMGNFYCNQEAERIHMIMEEHQALNVNEPNETIAEVEQVPNVDDTAPIVNIAKVEQVSNVNEPAPIERIRVIEHVPKVDDTEPIENIAKVEQVSNVNDPAPIERITEIDKFQTLVI